MIEGLIVAVSIGVLTAVLTRPVLRWLPEPAGAESYAAEPTSPEATGSSPTSADPKTLYRDLGTAGFVTGCGLLAGGAAAIAWLSLADAVQPLWWVLSSAGVLLAAIDAKTTWLPLRLTRLAWLLMAISGLVAAAAGGGWWLLLRVAGGAAAAGALYLVVWRVSQGGFGFGDVRFAPLLGAASAAQSWSLLLWSLVLGTLVGGVQGVARLACRQRDGFPYAPAMLAGAYLACAALAVTG